MNAIVVEGEAAPDEVQAAVMDELAARAARQRVVELHRADWEVARRLVQDAVREAERLEGRARARCMQLAAEALEIVHAGERRAWGLDAAGSNAGTRGNRSMRNSEKRDAEPV